MRLAFIIPTANPPQCTACFAAWRAQGWDCFALVNKPAEIPNATGIFRVETYAGWGESINSMALDLADRYDWLATGGDDCFPPDVPAEKIGWELWNHFGGTMGVCQATGDRWAWDKNGTTSPICYAPFIGSEFAKRWNSGRGPIWPDYWHFFGDNELYETSRKAGLLLERPDWTVEHRHPAKTGVPKQPYNFPHEPRWAADCDLYERRKVAGFPGACPT